MLTKHFATQKSCDSLQTRKGNMYLGAENVKANEAYEANEAFICALRQLVFTSLHRANAKQGLYGSDRN